MPRSVTILCLVLLAATGWMAARPEPSDAGPQPGPVPNAISQVVANTMPQRQPACFVPNLGQWDHPGRFLQRRGPMTLFIQDRGFVLDLVEPRSRPKARPNPRPKARPEAGRRCEAMPSDGEPPQSIRGVAVRMTFEGDPHVPEVRGEDRLPGHHNYFLGNDESRWQTHVPLYGSIRYLDLYPGIDVRLGDADGVPEYDLLLQPGADLSRVNVHVEGAEALSIAADGSLVMETALGPVVQRKPKTWQVDGDGRRREVASRFVLLGGDRFGFEAPGWDRDTHLTIDPPLIWSTYLGGSGGDSWVRTVVVDARGTVTLAGATHAPNFPRTTGAYDTTYNGRAPFYHRDAFVTQLDPSKTGAAQLIFSTFLGGTEHEEFFEHGLAVDARGLITVAGSTGSSDFPMSNAYDTTLNGVDAFVTQLDPAKTGSAQLVYSTYLGGSKDDSARAICVDHRGIVTVTGYAGSADFPMKDAHDTSFLNGEAFVTQLDPTKTGDAQLVYSTYLGGNSSEGAMAVCVDARGVLSVAGSTRSTNFPMTPGAYDTTHNGGNTDAFVSRLDPSRKTSYQLLYSTYLGGNYEEASVSGVAVDARGVITVAGWCGPGFPTTKDGYNTTDGRSFVSRLDPQRTGSEQLVYSTFLVGTRDTVHALHVDDRGVITVAGTTGAGFPTTPDAYSTVFGGGASDAFVSRLDPSKAPAKQLVYSTFLGGGGFDHGWGIAVDASGTAVLSGPTAGTFPTSPGAYDTTFNGGNTDAFVSRLSMGLAFYADRHEVSITGGGTQRLTLEAGQANAGRSYWVFGSVTGTTPGLTLGSTIGPVHIPLNPDIWTPYTMALANTSLLTNTKSTLDASGAAQASFNIPKSNLTSLIGLVFHHAYLVYDNNNNFYMASNPVPLKLVR